MIFSEKIKVSNFQIKSTEPLYSNTSWTGQRIIRSTGIQYYVISFQLSFREDERNEVQAFIAQYSQGKPFTISLGHLSKYVGNQVGALTATNLANKGTRVVNCTNNLAIGELVQFSNHSKIYRVLERNDTSITLFPALQNTVQANEVINYNNIMIEAVLDPDNDFTMTVANVMNLQLKATENIV